MRNFTKFDGSFKQAILSLVVLVTSYCLASSGMYGGLVTIEYLRVALWIIFVAAVFAVPVTIAKFLFNKLRSKVENV